MRGNNTNRLRQRKDSLPRPSPFNLYGGGYGLVENSKVREEEEIKQELNKEETMEGLEEEAQTKPENDEQKVDTQSLHAKNAELEQEKEEYLQSYLRLRADFENYRRRSREEFLQAAQNGKEELVLVLLPVLDNLERALGTTGEIEKWREGVEMIFRQLQEVLANEGLAPIPATGEMFNPQVHEAVLREPSSQPENTILEELKKGYLFKEKTLRPSLVKVAANDPDSVSAQEKE